MTIEQGGVAALSRALRVPATSIQNWVNRDDFPDPVVDEPSREWSLEEVRSWMAAHPDLPSLKPPSTDPLAGTKAADWPHGEHLTRGRMAKLFNCSSRASGFRLVQSAGFPSPVEPDRWDASEVLTWALLHAHRKVFAGWVEGTWSKGSSPEPKEGQVDLSGLAEALGVSERSARWYAYQEPTFPDEEGLGIWSLEDVLYWVDFEAPESTRQKLASEGAS